MKNQPFIEACRKFGFRNTPETLRYFYHPDHIGSTSWVTDNAKNGIQYCEYLPFGEPFLDQRSTTWNSRYTFSGKERDGETGYSYFGARYYNSDISIWLSVDPMADKYPNLTPYAYCRNNPIKLVDPNGMEFGDFFDWYGNYLGTDGKEDNNVFIVSDSKSSRKIKNNERNDKTTDASEVKVDVSTTKDVLKESTDVYDRTVKNGGDNEEATTYDANGIPKRYPTGNENTIDIDKSGSVSIHSHPLNELLNGNIFTTNFGKDDTEAFTGFSLNIIVGKSNCDPESIGCVRTPEASFYNNKSEKMGTINLSDIQKIINRK